MQVTEQQLEPDMEQWTGSKLGKEYVKARFNSFKWYFKRPGSLQELKK